MWPSVPEVMSEKASCCWDQTPNMREVTPDGQTVLRWVIHESLGWNKKKSCRPREVLSARVGPLNVIDGRGFGDGPDLFDRGCSTNAETANRSDGLARHVQCLFGSNLALSNNSRNKASQLHFTETSLRWFWGSVHRRTAVEKRGPNVMHG